MTQPRRPPEPGRPRRAVLALGSAGAAGVAAALAGCQVYGSEPGPAPAVEPAPAREPVPAQESVPPRESVPPPEPAPSRPGSGPVVAGTGDVAVGGGLILPEHQLVITQPAAGTFKGFSAVCTHQGCTVSTVRDGTINCACHGSRFSIEDGSVVQPAAGARNQGPLPPAAIAVAGEEITLG